MASKENANLLTDISHRLTQKLKTRKTSTNAYMPTLAIGSIIDEKVTKAAYTSGDVLIEAQNLQNIKVGNFDLTGIPSNIPKYTTNEIPIYKITNTRSSKDETIIALFLWSRLIKAPEDLTDETILSTYCSLYINIMNCNGEGEIKSVLNPLLMTAVYKETDTATLLTALKATNGVELENILTEIEDDNLDHEEYLTLCGMMISLIIFFLGKRLHPSCTKDYFDRRYRAFASTCAAPAIAQNVSQLNLYPLVGNCIRFYDLISGNHPLRKLIFNTSRAIVGRNQAPYANSFRSLLKYLAYAELTHIEMINTYLLTLFPEIMSLRPLNTYQKALSDALVYLHSLPEADRPYVKILYTQEETQILNRSNFDMLACAAHCVARELNPTFNNYQVPNRNLMQKMDSIIKAYVNSRLSGTREIILSGHNTQSKEEKDRELKHIEEKEILISEDNIRS